MRSVSLILFIVAILTILLPPSILAQPMPHVWMIHFVSYPNGDPVPAANLSFNAWLRKVSGTHTDEIVTQDIPGSGVGDLDPQVWVECSTFGDWYNPSSWWAVGDTIYCRIFAANDPVTGLTDSVTVWDVLVAQPGISWQYYQGEIVWVPIELISFSAQRQGRGVLLSWTVAREVDNLGFYVQRARASDGVFARISDLIPGRGTSDVELTYAWTDPSPEGQVVWYRLEDVDFQGRSTIHGPLRVVVREGSSWGGIKAAFSD